MKLPSDYATVEGMNEEEFIAHVKRQNGDKRVWLLALRRLITTGDVDAFLANWNALGLAGNRFAREWTKELLQERREMSSSQLTDQEREYMGLERI